MSLNVSDLKAFVGSADFETSRDFYVAIGWTLNWETAEVAELQHGDQRFLLQRYYQKDWCENSMLHLTVEDAQAWCDRITAVLESRSYGSASVEPPQKQPYGALVTFLRDPSGVLWHLAQPE